MSIEISLSISFSESHSYSDVNSNVMLLAPKEFSPFLLGYKCFVHCLILGSYHPPPIPMQFHLFFQRYEKYLWKNLNSGKGDAFCIKGTTKKSCVGWGSDA